MFGSRHTKQNYSTKRRTKRFPLDRTRRVGAQLQRVQTKEVVQGRAFLHDLSLQGISMFSEIPLEINESIAIVIEQPRHLYIKAKVRSSVLLLPTSRVLSVEPMPYRVGLEFIFDTPEEREAIERYCEELTIKNVR